PLIPKDKAVPIDVRLGGEYSALIITGPNTGGKTVALKTLGLLSLMAACGLHIPVAEGSKAAFFKSVMADIGDEQSIEQSLSTFSAHMKNIIAILGCCDKDSLVLFDEIGAGTDPVEGAALAIAILEKVRSTGAALAATTHYAELKQYALNTEGVENASCEFDVKSLKPTYRLLIGVPGRSNAFAIAERLGLDGGVISRAGELISADNSRFEEVISKLETARQAAEKEKEHANDLLRQASARKAKAEQEYLGLERTRDALLKDAEKEKERLLTESRKEVAAIMDRLNKLARELDDEEVRKKILEAKLAANTGLNKLESEIAERKPVNDHYELPRPLKVGDSVFVTDVNRNGTVQSLPDKNGKLTVIVGNVKMKLDQSSLRLLEGSIGKPKNVGGSSVVRVETPAKLDIDVRGKTAMEAEIELDSFIDNCVMNKVKNFTIIHGKGTGALRAAVAVYLKSHKAVKSFRPGAYGEGEHGVTVVELK
ncbi:MAG: Smr/MutS family protein, partial [Clostridia bacterium]|nr:Smr/MutS family protein [Clostridia bacterium]